MEFDKTKVYTALNATEELIGARGYFDNDLARLRNQVVNEFTRDLKEFKGIECDYYILSVNSTHIYNFFYLVEPAPEKWYVYKNNFVLADGKIIYEIVKNTWAYEGEPKFSGSKEECEQWIEEHSKPKYRPFKDCDELISYFCHKYSILKTDWGMPFIWVKNKNHSEKYLIIAVTENCVVLYTNGQVFDMQELFEHYTFLDGSVCGGEE